MRFGLCRGDENGYDGRMKDPWLAGEPGKGGACSGGLQKIRWGLLVKLRLAHTDRGEREGKPNSAKPLTLKKKKTLLPSVSYPIYPDD